MARAITTEAAGRICSVHRVEILPERGWDAEFQRSSRQSEFAGTMDCRSGKDCACRLHRREDTGWAAEAIMMCRAVLHGAGARSRHRQSKFCYGILTDFRRAKSSMRLRTWIATAISVSWRASAWASTRRQ